jgi:8-oxo-dGDP phosphatase
MKPLATLAEAGFGWPGMTAWPTGVSVGAVADAMSDEPSRWRTFGERVIYDNPWVWLGQIDVEIPGGERFWHHVVRLHRAAVMVLVDDQDRVLMLWRHRFVQDRWGWELPGGLVDDGEDPQDTAIRELEEETGYRAGRIEHLVSFQPMVGMVDSEHLIFVGRDPEKYHCSMRAVIQRPWHDPALRSEEHAVLDSDQRQSPAHPLNTGRVTSGCLNERTKARSTLRYSVLQNVPCGLNCRPACSGGWQSAHARPDCEIVQPRCRSVPDALGEATSSRLIRYR